jgi:hypothetical protein
LRPYDRAKASFVRIFVSSHFLPPIGGFSEVRVVPDPEISDFVHIIFDVPVTGSVDDLLDKDTRWSRRLHAAILRAPRVFFIAVNYQESSGQNIRRRMTGKEGLGKRTWFRFLCRHFPVVHFPVIPAVPRVSADGAPLHSRRGACMLQVSSFPLEGDFPVSPFPPVARRLCTAPKDVQ